MDGTVSPRRITPLRPSGIQIVVTRREQSPDVDGVGNGHAPTSQSGYGWVPGAVALEHRAFSLVCQNALSLVFSMFSF